MLQVSGLALSENNEMERRLAAALAADAAGFSGPTDQGEMCTLRTLAAQRSILVNALSRNPDRIARTAGDSVLASFPSAANAGQCAVKALPALRGTNNG